MDHRPVNETSSNLQKIPIPKIGPHMMNLQEVPMPYMPEMKPGEPNPIML